MGKFKFKSRVIGVAAGIILAAAPGAALASSSNAGSHVTLCHRTGSNSNPYVRISPDVSGAYNGHYREHQGPVYPAAGWGDIIPPFTYNGQTYSLNWNAQGQAIFNNGCVPTGGQGGGPGGGGGGGGTTTTTSSSTTGQVLGASTTAGGQGAGQIALVPQGSVNGGEGAAALSSSHFSIVGLIGSLLMLGSGLAMLNRRHS